MYEDIAIVLSAGVIYLEWKAVAAKSEMNGIFYSLMATVFAVALAAAGVVVAQQYGSGVVAIATAIYITMVIIMIASFLFLGVWLFFFELLPKKYRPLLRVFW